MKMTILLFCAFLFFIVPSLRADEYHGCYIELRKDTLYAGNTLIERQWLWNNGDIIPFRLVNKTVSPFLVTDMGKMDTITPAPDSSDFRVIKIEGNAIRQDMLTAEIVSDYGSYLRKTIVSLYPGSPAIRTQYAFLLEDGHEPQTELKSFILDRINLPSLQYTLTAVEFFDRTDVNNNLVDEDIFLPFLAPVMKRGNLLLAKNSLGYDSFFLLKEAPCSFVQLNYPGYDFTVNGNQILIIGTGLSEDDLQTDDWVYGYSSVVGVSYGRYPLEYALRTYQKNLRRHDDARDDMIMMNTWGDRNRDASIGEAFCKREIDACVKYGITNFQIDDGWQTGISHNSANPQGSLWDRWSIKDWQPNPEKFPNGFGEVVKYAKARHIEPGLWFHPSNAEGYAGWKQDAEVIAGLNRDYGIRYFKIDGIKIPDKRSEINLRKFFEYALELTDNQVVFNVDATADNRGGYNFLNGYGNIFLENRYTDWAKYYPHWTLRNLWQLSAYIPAEDLQIEFLNKWRNADKYPEGDSLAPAYIPFDYEFATTMAAQPLAWFEGSHLPPEAEEIIPVIRAYKSVWHDFHNGIILPVGKMPDGSSWTGFQSIGQTYGYFLIFREKSPESRFVLKTYLAPGQELQLHLIAGSGNDRSVKAGPDGEIAFSLESEFSFALYRYDVTK